MELDVIEPDEAAEGLWLKRSIRCDLHKDRLRRRCLQATRRRLCLECCIEKDVPCTGVKPLAGTTPKTAPKTLPVRRR